MTEELAPISGTVPVASVTALEVINRSEIEQQVSTARKYPRSVVEFRRKVEQMATLSPTVAQSLFYRLPRGGKKIEGPSVRLAEIAASSYGNLRVGSFITDIGQSEVTARGFAHDLENNVAYASEVKRSIVDKDGIRYKNDMIIVTCNAACAIALRNAVFKAVPMVLVEEPIRKAKALIRGDQASFPQRRDDMLKKFDALGVKKERVFAAIDRRGVDDVTLDDMVDLAGLYNQIEDGELTVDEAFPQSKPNRFDKRETAPIDVQPEGKGDTK
jgi:hypothetical protein